MISNNEKILYTVHAISALQLLFNHMNVIPCPFYGISGQMQPPLLVLTSNRANAPHNTSDFPIC